MKKYEDTNCENCDRPWGYHYDLKCYDGQLFPYKSETGRFRPIGYELTDICKHCGQELQAHYLRMQCMGDHEGCTFERFKIQKLKLEDELFEI